MSIRKRVGALCAALIVIGTSCSLNVPSPASSPGGYALVYGVSLYDSGYAEGAGNNLTYADDDALAVSAMLANSNYDVTVRTDSQATLANLISDIALVQGSIAPNENFILYFSGHGARLPANTDSTQEPADRDSSDEWIFLYGSVDYSSITDLSLAIADNQLQQLLAGLPTERKIIILDACNSGGFIGSQLEIDSVPQDSDGPDGEGLIEAILRYFRVPAGASVDVPSTDAVVIAASGEQEDTYEYSLYGHGVFTYHFLSAPQAADSNNDGFVTTGECYAYACDMVTLLWQDASFQPRISGGPVDFVLFGAD